MALSDSYARDTKPLDFRELPVTDVPCTDQPMLEAQIELACEAINKANSELEHVEYQRSEALKKLAEAREKLLEKCSHAADVLHAHEKPKTVNH